MLAMLTPILNLFHALHQRLLQDAVTQSLSHASEHALYDTGNPLILSVCLCRMLGFNAVRVAFAFDDNWGINSPVVDWTGPCDVPTEKAIMKTLVPGKNASTTIKSNANALPELAPPDVPDGICNSDWPKDSTYQRFIWVIDYLISQVSLAYPFYCGFDYT